MKNLIVALLLLTTSFAVAQSKVVITDVPSPSLTDVPQASEARQVRIYLPPSYNSNTMQKYPVLYVLHGFGGAAESWFSPNNSEPNISRSMDKLLAQEKLSEMIIVVPDSKGYNLASWYQHSAVTGNWRNFILEDLQQYVANHYRITNQQSILGHSMGGYGAAALAVYEKFDAVAAMSPAPVLVERVPASDIDELVQGVNDLWPMFSGFDGTDASIVYDAHMFMSLIQLVAPDLSNPPSYLPQRVTREHYDAFNELKLETLVANNIEFLGDTAFRFEYGVYEGPEMAAAVSSISELLESNGITSSVTNFRGGHTNMIYKTLEDNLIFIDRVWHDK